MDDPLEPLWKKAQEAADCGDMPGVLFLWKALADKGVWQLYARIGNLYERGAKGIERDTVQALSWYRKAVFEGDDPIAHVGLGRAYYNATACERDYSVAKSHFKKAYELDSPEAAVYLGIISYCGVGGERDVLQAQRYFDHAASSGYPIAYFYSGRIALYSGRLIRGIKLFLKGWMLGARIARDDPADPRLLGVDRPTA